MKNSKIFTRAFFVLIALVLAAGCTASPSLSVASGSSLPDSVQPAQPAYQTGTGGSSSSQGITVVGIGTATGTPDMAQVNVGVETEAVDVQKAVNDNQTKMTALLAALKAQGIDSKDIRTSNYSVYTERVTPPASSAEVSSDQMLYHVTNQVDVTVRDVNQIGDVLDKAVAAGANNIYGVNFSVENTAKLEADARAKAVADGRARAEELAQLNGVQLGDVLTVSEVVGSSPYPMDYSAKGMGGGGGTPVQPGELEMSVSIQITYAVK